MEPHFTQLYSHFGRADIGGFRDDVLDRQVAEVMAGVVQRVPAKRKDAVLTVKDLVKRYSLFVQRRRDHDRLESRARFERVGDDPVAQVGDGRFAPDLVRVIVGQRGHRQNGACPRTNDDARDADRRVPLHSFGQFGLNHVLHAGVERESDVQTRTRGDVFFTKEYQLLTAYVFLGLPPARHAVESRIEGSLDAVLADQLRHRVALDKFVCRGGEPQNMRRQRAGGINTQLVVHRLRVDGPLTQVQVKRTIATRQFFLVDAKGKALHRRSDFFPVLE